MKDFTEARAHAHQTSGLCESQEHSARGLERQILGLLSSQNFAGSVGWKIKWAKELRILEEEELERWTVKSLEEEKKTKPKRTCKFWGNWGGSGMGLWVRLKNSDMLFIVDEERNWKNRGLWLDSRY